MRRHAFSLVELLVAITIILVLMALMGAAVSAARSAAAKQRTQATIATIDEILRRHFVNCESSRTDGSGTNRVVALRRQVTADMPDSWHEVRHMKANPQQFNSARQRSYVATLNEIKPTDQLGDAECLFMIMMQGGLADCLTCGGLSRLQVGDSDRDASGRPTPDGAPEFLDAWGEPIRYVLWPAAFELPPGTDYFSMTAPFEGGIFQPAPDNTNPAPGGTMRPLLFSAGADKMGSTRVNNGSYLAMGANCGNPLGVPNVPREAPDEVEWLGGQDDVNNPDYRGDNITNFDTEVKR